MAKITMELIKELREKTQVGMMDCKKALIEAEGNLEKATDILRKKGADVAQKRADKETNNGNIGCCISQDSKAGVLVKIGCETDFSANTNDMKDFCNEVCLHILEKKPSSISGNENSLVSQALFSDPTQTIGDRLNELVAKIGEKIEISDFARFQVQNNGLINAYIHPGANLGVIVELETNNDPSPRKEKIAQLATDICMQVAVTNPMCIDPSQLDEKTLTKEKTIIQEQLLAAGKPENIIDKITKGKMNKFYQKVCLLNQLFIKNDKVTVKKHIEQISKETDLQITFKNFKRFVIG
jgi:elongation factor Ts